MNISLVMFLVFIAITLGITYWASRRSAGAAAYFAASRQIKGWQNGIAVAGDYMSAASFLGIAGIIAFQGYDGFLFSVGWLVAYLTVCWSWPSLCVTRDATPWPTSSPIVSSPAPYAPWPRSALSQSARST